MSPPEFDKAWKARNERLEAAGVFDQLTELEEAYGERLWSMTPSEPSTRSASYGSRHPPVKGDRTQRALARRRLNPPVGQSDIVASLAISMPDALSASTLSL
jgi:hypothetical protein